MLNKQFSHQPSSMFDWAYTANLRQCSLQFITSYFCHQEPFGLYHDSCIAKAIRYIQDCRVECT